MSKFTLIARIKRGAVLRQFRVEEDDFETCVASLRKMMDGDETRREPTNPPVIGEAS